jgi:hypothetical protein
MTPAEEEALFIRLWTAGTETAEIARQPGLKATTAQARARRLQLRGLIQPRPRGGAYPTQKAQARQEGAPAPPATPTPPAAQVPPTPPFPPATPAMTFVAVPETQEMLSLMKDLQAWVISLEQARVPPALPAPPVPPAHPAAERKEIQQWTVRCRRP